MADPKLKQAFEKAIQFYFDNGEFEKMNELGERKFTKKYFDELDGQLFPEEEQEKKKTKRKK